MISPPNRRNSSATHRHVPRRTEFLSLTSALNPSKFCALPKSEGKFCGSSPPSPCLRSVLIEGFCVLPLGLGSKYVPLAFNADMFGSHAS